MTEFKYGNINVSFIDNDSHRLQYIEIGYDEGRNHGASSGSVSLYDEKLDKFLEACMWFKSMRDIIKTETDAR